MTPYEIKLRQELDRISAGMLAITALAEKENNRGLTSAELESFKAAQVDYDRIEASIVAEKKAHSIDALLKKVETGAVKIDDTNIEEIRANFRLSPGEKRRREHEKDPHAKAFASYLRNGELTDPKDRKILSDFSAGYGLDVRNAMSTTTGSQGGDVVPQGFSGMLEEAKKWFGGIDGTVAKFTTGTGNPFPWPTINDTTNKGRIIGQNVQTIETDLVFGQVTFNAYIGSSDLILIPLALMQDSYFDLDALVARLLGIRLGRLYNYQCTVGTGTASPTGIVTAVAANGTVFQLGTGNTASIAYANLVDLQHSVDPAYRENPAVRWMFSDTELKLLKKLVDSQNRPLWQPGLTSSFQGGANVIGGFKPRILEDEYVINQDMAVPAASAYTILYGDMSTFKVREVAGGTTVLVLRERYADYLQVGFTAFQRFDSQYVYSGGAALALLQQSAS
jgi:HK97 family phage major capsid protein